MGALVSELSVRSGRVPAVQPDNSACAIAAGRLKRNIQLLTLQQRSFEAHSLIVETVTPTLLARSGYDRVLLAGAR
jgi:hypothetical protein